MNERVRIAQIGDPILRKKCEPLEEVNDAIEKHLVNKPIITIIAGLDK